MSALLLSGCNAGPAPPETVQQHEAAPVVDGDVYRIAELRELPEYYHQPEIGANGERAAPDPATITVSGRSTGEGYAHGGVGLSFEATELGDERLSAGNPDLVQLLEALDQPTLRFGGNSVDRRFFFTAHGEKAPSDWPLQKGEKITTVTPEDLQRVAALAEATGAKVVLGADLAANDPRRAGDLARHAEEAFGENLIALMVGNEPNGYFNGEDGRLTIKDRNWGIPEYLTDLKEYVSAIRAEVPDLPITAPGAYAPDWWRAVAQSGIPSTVLGVHHYPLSSCAGSVPRQRPAMENLVAGYTRGNVDRFLRIAVDQGRQAGIPVWLTETSVSACPGSNDITGTLGSAVFAAEYSLRAQSLGVERLAHHSSLDRCAGGPPMSPICSSGTEDERGEALAPRANHLGLALVGQIPDGDFLATEVAGNEDITAYAIDHGADGSARVTLAVANFGDPVAVGRTSVTVRLPFAYREAVMTQLGGPGWDAEYPSASLFDVDPPPGGPRTEDEDGRTQTLENALTPPGAGHVSVDGWGLPLTPVEHRPAVSGADAGDEELEVSLNPGTMTVFTLTRK